MKGNRTSLTSFTAALAFMTACHGSNQASDASSAKASAVAMTQDQQVISLVLDHFAKRTDTSSIAETGIVVLKANTNSWKADGFNFPTVDANAKCSIPGELYQSLVVRNGIEQSAETLLTPSPNWRLANAEETAKVLSDFQPDASGRQIKTLATLSMPGFSKDKKQALVVLYFSWSIHAALARYVLTHSSGGWSVTCSQLDFYV